MIYVQLTLTHDMIYVFCVQLFKRSEDPLAYMIYTHNKMIDLLQRKGNTTVPM